MGSLQLEAFVTVLFDKRPFGLNSEIPSTRLFVGQPLLAQGTRGHSPLMAFLLASISPESHLGVCLNSKGLIICYIGPRRSPVSELAQQLVLQLRISGLAGQTDEKFPSIQQTSSAAYV